METALKALVLGERSELMLGLLRDRGVDALAVEAPEADELAAADVVVLAAPHDCPLPDVVWDVLAAGCLLVAPRAEPRFGLEPGIDHLSAGTDGELADLAALAATFPAVVEPIVAMGRLAAQSRSASA